MHAFLFALSLLFLASWASGTSQKFFPCPAGGKASMRPRSASARGGSSAAPGKRAYSSCGDRREYFVFPTFPKTQFLISRLWNGLLKRSTSDSIHRFIVYDFPR